MTGKRCWPPRARRQGGALSPASGCGVWPTLSGGRDANLALSKRRAEVVAAALRRHGFGQVDFQVSAVGDASMASPGGDIRLMRRRVDLEIHLAPR